MDPEREQIIYGYKSRFDGGARADFCSHARSLPHTTQALASRADLERATRRGAQFRCDQWRGLGEGSPDRDYVFYGWGSACAEITRSSVVADEARSRRAPLMLLLDTVCIAGVCACETVPIHTVLGSCALPRSHQLSVYPCT